MKAKTKNLYIDVYLFTSRSGHTLLIYSYIHTEFKWKNGDFVYI